MSDASIEPGDNTDENDSYGSYSVDAEDQPQGDGESMTDARGLTEPLDEGYSPPEKWSAGQGFGNTPLEEAMGENLDQRLAQEVPEPDPYVEAERVADLDDLDDGEVGDDRAGRLVADDQGLGPDDDSELHASDVGIDGAGASAEEAAVHEVPETEAGGTDLGGRRGDRARWAHVAATVLPSRRRGPLRPEAARGPAPGLRGTAGR